MNTRTLTLVREGDSGFGCKLRHGTNVVSTVFSVGAAQVAGVLPGDEIMSINGKPVEDALLELQRLKQRHVSTAVLDVLRVSCKRQQDVAASSSTPPASSKKQGIPQSVTSSDAVQAASKKQTISQSVKSSVAVPAASKKQAISQLVNLRAEAPAASKAATAPALEPLPKAASKAAPSASESRRLLLLVKSPAVDVKRYVLALLARGDPSVVAFLAHLYPPTRAIEQCVFCGASYVVGACGTCSVFCDIVWDDEGYEREFVGHGGYGGTFTGRCTRCGGVVSARGDEERGPEDPRISCFQGSHQSDPACLRALRVQACGGEDKYAECFGVEDNEDESFDD